MHIYRINETLADFEEEYVGLEGEESGPEEEMEEEEADTNNKPSIPTTIPKYYYDEYQCGLCVDQRLLLRTSMWLVCCSKII